MEDVFFDVVVVFQMSGFHGVGRKFERVHRQRQVLQTRGVCWQPARTKNTEHVDLHRHEHVF